MRCTLRRLITTPSPRTICQTLVAKCRLRGRPSRLGSSQAIAITSAQRRVGELLGAPRTRRVLEREPVLRPPSSPLADPRQALAQTPGGVRAAHVGLFVQQEHEPGTLHLGVWEVVGGGPDLGLGDLRLGEDWLVLGRRATVPGPGTGHRLYRRQRRASVGRIVGKTTLPTDAPLPRLLLVAGLHHPT
jgi:hypothetical protein